MHGMEEFPVRIGLTFPASKAGVLSVERREFMDAPTRGMERIAFYFPPVRTSIRGPGGTRTHTRPVNSRLLSHLSFWARNKARFFAVGAIYRLATAPFDAGGSRTQRLRPESLLVAVRAFCLSASIK